MLFPKSHQKKLGVLCKNSHSRMTEETPFSR